MTSTRPLRRNPKAYAIIGGSTALALTAGLLIWLQVSDEPAVAVPSRVCDGTLPGAAVKALLPKRGKPFSERLDGAFNPRIYLDLRNGTCVVRGGGKSIRIDERFHSDLDHITMKDVERDANAADADGITLGKAKGFHKGDVVSLFTDCSSKVNENITLVRVDVTYEKTTDRADIQNMASLAADTLRLEARELWACAGANDLPDGSPRIG